MKTARFLFIVSFALLSACSSGADLQISDPAQPIEVAAGEEFTIVLDANPTTGYHWEFVEELSDGMLEFVSRDYVADQPVTTGSGGVDVWTFRAAAPGRTHITLGYYSPSFDPEGPEQTVMFNVTVK